MPAPSRSRLRVLIGAGTAVALALTVSGCAGGTGTADGPGTKQAADKPKKVTSQVQLAVNVPDGTANVRVNRQIVVSATDGTLRTVQVRTLKGVVVGGAINGDRSKWIASDRLDSGRKYVVSAVAADGDGVAKTFSSRFSTMTLTKSQQTFPNVYPQPGATVGVGLPIMVSFTDPVTDKARFERHMTVTTSSGQKGSWYWIDDTHAHFRPQTYWKPNQKVDVDLDLKNVSAGNGIYGQVSRKYSFNIARSLVIKVGISSHQMQVFRDGKLSRTLPTTTGKPGFDTRSGTKVIVEKDRFHDMDSTTIGIANDAPDGYNLKAVEYAMRLTFSGEFIHAAPWSVGSQGHTNASHGCTGLSTANAGWVFSQAMIGDPVEYSGSTPNHMTLSNGYGDWNLSWADWQKGSAL